ncbi:MAG: hypothetical protein LBP79_00070 [Clostridiales bacterium]|jgi:hypothetical protein|nr:hypothetical protein [Clostridiales bacterium]
MIKISTQFNAADERALKRSQKSILTAGAVCASFGLIGGIILAVVVDVLFLVLLIGSAIIAATSLLFCRRLAASVRKRTAYNTISFSGDRVEIQRRDETILTPIPPAAYPLRDCVVTESAEDIFMLKTPEKSYFFNEDGFTEGTKADLRELLKQAR